MREHIIIYPVIGFLFGFFGSIVYLLITDGLNSNTTIGAFIVGFISAGIAIADSIVYRSKLKTIAEGKKIAWWQKDTLSWKFWIVTIIVLFLIIIVFGFLLISYS